MKEDFFVEKCGLWWYGNRVFTRKKESPPFFIEYGWIKRGWLYQDTSELMIEKEFTIPRYVISMLWDMVSGIILIDYQNKKKAIIKKEDLFTKEENEGDLFADIKVKDYIPDTRYRNYTKAPIESRQSLRGVI